MFLEKDDTIFTVLQYSYSLLDLESENVFVVNMNLSVCYESAGPCEISIPVFDQHKLNKPACNWTRGFAVNGRFLLLLTGIHPLSRIYLSC